MTLDWQIALTGLGAALALMTVVWAASVKLENASIVDIYWGPAFALLAWTYQAALPAEPTLRGWIACALVSAWALRLALHIWLRNRGQGEDRRYVEIRRRNQPGFAWKSLFIVFWLQAFLAWVISASLLHAVTAQRPEGLTGLDLAGIALFVFGFLFEATADYQLVRFKADPGNRGKVLDRGLWRFSRHPNYFGEATLWWGFFLIALAAPGGWWTLVSPVLITFLLLKVSGVTLLEKNLEQTKPAYADYVRRTSAFVPLPPRPKS